VAALAFNEIIIGSGAGGAVVAARLSEDPDRSVLLLEAGPDYPTVEQLPEDLRNPWISLVEHDWGFHATAEGARLLPYPRGKAVGGSTAVNGTVAMRGAPADFEAWAALGNDEWTYDRVAPYYRRLEQIAGADPDVHGTSGPIWVQPARPQVWQPIARAYVDALRAMGYPVVADHNDPAGTGVGPVAHNVRDGVRISTSIGYLLPARGRPNLTIRSDALVNRILLANGRAVGVELVSDGRLEQIAGDRVTLAAGAIGTPAVLTRSGIGPVQELDAFDIPVVLDVGGVGHNLIDHCAVFVTALAAPDIDQDPSEYFEFYLRSGDFYLALLPLYSALTLGTFIGAPDSPPVIAIAPGVALPRSRGSVALASTDATIAPRISLNFLEHPDDRKTLLDGVRLAWDVLHSPELAPLVSKVLPPVSEIIDSDGALTDWMLGACGSGWHPVGTARMGPDSDAGAVVDQHGRLRGIEHLRVADASVMPLTVSAPTNLTCMMIGERVAEWMRTEPD
jgi:choline dehydrogenase